jgi:hypothetical protein
MFSVSCGRIITAPDTGDPSEAKRRLYVNDAAANDSLVPALVHEGVRFVMQPGKSYALTLDANESDDQLAVFYYDDGGTLREYRDYGVDIKGAQEFFYLNSNQSKPRFFVAQLLPPDGNLATTRFENVRLISLGGESPNSLKIKLIFVGGLKGLGTNAAKNNFAVAFFEQMTTILQGQGLAVTFEQEIVEPNAAPKVLQFGGNYTSLPGTRVPGFVHMYLVDSIAPPPGTSDQGGYILGFAPREAMDLSLLPQSRVVLGNRYITLAGLATTAAHELGHFFGLRHTTATEIDMGYDKDFSNVDDGLTATGGCTGLAKRGTAVGGTAPDGMTGSHWVDASGEAFCLRTTATSESACPAACDLSNLMFPYDCSSRGNLQRVLTSDQLTLWKKNLALME